MRKWKREMLEEIKSTLLSIRAGGGTDLTSGFTAAVDQFPEPSSSFLFVSSFGWLLIWNL